VKFNLFLDKESFLSYKEIYKGFTRKKVLQAILPLLGFFFFVFVLLRIWFKPKELYDFFHSYEFYFNLGQKQPRHTKEWKYFFIILYKFEWLVLMGGIAGSVIAVIQRKKIDLFFMGWTISILFVYSLVSYKTPWLILSVTVPMVFLMGSFIHFCMEKISKKDLKGVILAGFLLLCFMTLNKSWALSHRIFNDRENPYFYAHTDPSAHVLEKRLKTLMDKNPNATVVLASPEHWPMPFLLREYKQVGFWGKVPEKIDAQIIISRDNQRKELPANVIDSYEFESYILRGGVNLELYFHKDLKQ